MNKYTERQEDKSSSDFYIFPFKPIWSFRELEAHNIFYKHSFNA